MSDVQDFACEHHDGWTSVALTFDGLRVTWRVFYRVGNPHAPWEARHLLLCGSRTPDDACGDRGHLFGPVPFPQYPQRLLPGGALGRRGGGSSGWHTDMVLALQFKMELAPSASGRCDVRLAAVRGRDEAQAQSDAMVAPEAAKREDRRMCAARQARRATLRVRTPDAQIDGFVNAWLKRGLEYSRIKKGPTRDNLQFADGLTMSAPARVRAELLRPAFPPTWPEAQITLRRGAETYRIRIERSAGVKQKQTSADGKSLSGDFLPFQPAGTHDVVIRLPGKNA